MSARAYTFTVRRSRLVLAGGAVVVLVGTLAYFGKYAWMVNAGLVLLVAWLLHQIRRPRVVSAVRKAQSATSDGQLIADAIQTASIRDMVLRDMRGQR